MKLTDALFGKVIIPFAYFIRGDMRFYYYWRYKKNLRLTREQIKALQEKKLRKLIRHSYDTVPYYRELFDSLGLVPDDIRSVDDLKKLPVLDKVTLVRRCDDLVSSKRYKLKEYSSGGSTGFLVTVKKDKKYSEKSKAVVLRDLYSVGVKPGEKVAWIWGSPLENLPLQEKFLHRSLWWINRRIFFNAAKYTEADMLKWIRGEFTRFRPKYIYGYSNLIYEVAKCIDKHRLKIPKIEKIISTAEKLEHREFIEKVFSCKVLDQYGSREILEIAIEDDNRNMHSADDFVIVEVDKESNILVTPLESYGMPLLRYKIGDKGSIKPDNHHKAKVPFNQFNISIGRSCEILVGKNNDKITFADFKEVLTEKLRVGEFQIIQKSFNDVHLNIIRDELTKDDDVKRLAEIIKDKLGCKKITIKYFKRFPKTKSGKKLELINQMSYPPRTDRNVSKYYKKNKVRKFIANNFFEPAYSWLHSRKGGIDFFRFIKDMQWKSMDENIRYQEDELFRLLSYTVKNIRFYRQFAEKNNITIRRENIRDILKKFPVMDKDLMRKEFDNLYKFIPSVKHYVNSSGGSTGMPMTLYQDNDYKIRMMQIKKLQKEWAHLEFGESVIKLWGSERDIVQGKRDLKHRLANWIRGVETLNSFTMDESNMHKYVNKINSSRPKMILAYAQSIYELAKFIEENSLQVHSPESIMTSAGILYPEFRETIERVFRCRVFNRYGSREVGDIAAECDRHEGLHVSMYTHFIEILDKELNPVKEGETGDIYVTLLTNYTMPLIRYRIGDMAVYTSRKCSCGRGLQLIENVIGRDMDVFRTREGKIIPGEFFIHFIGVVYNSGDIRRFQVIQKDYDHIIIKVVAVDESKVRKKVSGVEDAIRKAIGDSTQIEWVFVDDIKPTRSGKYRYTIREFE